MLGCCVPAPARGSRRAPLPAPTSPPSGLGFGGVAQSGGAVGGCEGPWGSRLGSALARPLLPLSQTFISVAPAAPGGAAGCSAGTPNWQHPGTRHPELPAPQPCLNPGTPTCEHPGTPKCQGAHPNPASAPLARPCGCRRIPQPGPALAAAVHPVAPPGHPGVPSRTLSEPRSPPRSPAPHGPR